MRRYISAIILSLSFALTAGAYGIDPRADSVAVMQMREKMAEIRKHRPTVAVVLSGGGAKGAAHVGVLRYIEELGIPVDMVVGTSMGGLVGGLYALGYDVPHIDSLMRNMDWGWVLSDKLSREYISYTDLKYKEKYMISIPFFYEKDYYKMKLADDSRFTSNPNNDILHIGADNADGPEMLKRNLLGSLPVAYISGQNVSNLLSSLSVGYQDSLSFSELPIPFACVATDMVSGKAKVWHSGKIKDAMRSTMSIPGVFAPVKMDGMVLVDGGLRDNYPTSLARDMGADIIIGVDVGIKTKEYGEINNIADILSQGVGMLGREAFEKNVDIPDVRIKPDLKNYHMMSFNAKAIDHIMELGYEAAAAQDSLMRSIAEKTAGGYVLEDRGAALDFHRDSIVISDVDIKGVFLREKELLMKRMDFKLGQKISKEDIEHFVARIYGTQSYDFVTYELLGKESPYKLVLTCKKGPIHQLGIGVRADTEEIVSVLVNLGFNTHKLQGSTFDLTGKISANPYFHFLWSYDAPKMPTVNASASIRWTDLSTLNFADNKLSLSFLHSRQEIFLSNIKWKKFDINVGLRNDVFDVRNVKSEQIIGNYDFDQLTNDFVSVFAKGRMDTFDDGYYPMHGVNAGVSYAWTFAGFPHNFDNFHTIQADVKGVIPIGDIFAFIPSANVRFLLGSEIPVAYFNAIGGSLPGRYVDQQVPFVGVTNLHAMKNIMTMVRADFRFKVARNHYLTGIFNYVRDCDYFKDYIYGLGYFGAGLEYGYDTIFGPIKANVHWSNLTKKVGVYVSAGYNF